MPDPAHDLVPCVHEDGVQDQEGHPLEGASAVPADDLGVDGEGGVGVAGAEVGGQLRGGRAREAAGGGGAATERGNLRKQIISMSQQICSPNVKFFSKTNSSNICEL